MRVDGPELNKAPAESLTEVLDQSPQVKTIVEESAEDLAVVNTALTQELATAAPPPRVATALEKSESVESKVQQASETLARVNEALKEEVRERQGLEDRLAALTEQSEADRHGWILAVMFVDLNNFKGINDQYGHEAGDCVLQVISDRLKKITRRDDTICRHGGDGFFYLLAEISKEKDAVMIAKKLIAAIQEPCAIPVKDSSVTVAVGASIGIALSPKHGADAERLVRHADAAMHEAKRGNSGYSVALAG